MGYAILRAAAGRAGKPDGGEFAAWPGNTDLFSYRRELCVFEPRCQLLPVLVTKPAIRADLVLPVALDTAAHADVGFLPQRIARFDRPVAGAAGRARSQVFAMTELDVAGNLVHARPSDRLLRIRKLLQFLDSRRVLRDRHMTSHALGRRRESFDLARIRIRMAVLALEPERNVQLVTEGHGLFGNVMHLGRRRSGSGQAQQRPH